jgi:hypothetical protein
MSIVLTLLQSAEPRRKQHQMASQRRRVQRLLDRAEWLEAWASKVEGAPDVPRVLCDAARREAETKRARASALAVRNGGRDGAERHP